MVKRRLPTGLQFRLRRGGGRKSDDGKWKCVALWHRQERGAVRFNELMRLMSSVIERTLQRSGW